MQKYFVMVLVLSMLLLMNGFCFGRSVSGGLFLAISNSNFSQSSGPLSVTTDLDLHYGLGAEIGMPITDQIVSNIGLIYYAPVGGPDLNPDVKIGLIPVYGNVKVYFSDKKTAVNPYVGAGVTFTNWVLEGVTGIKTTMGIGYDVCVGMEANMFLLELGYIFMGGSISSGGETNTISSSGIQLKAGLAF
jgi:hypothetical protein